MRFRRWALPLALFLLSSCRSKAPQETWDLYRNETLGVTLKIPHDWKRFDFPDKNAVIFSSHKSTVGNGVFDIVRTDRDAMYERLGNAPAFPTQTLRGLVYSESRLGGRRAIKIEGRRALSERNELGYIVRQGDHLLTLHGMAPAGETWSATLPVLLQIFDSIQWTTVAEKSADGR